MRTLTFPFCLFVYQISKSPPNPLLYSNRSVTLLKLGQPAPALDDALKAVELEPRFWKGFSRMGDALAALGNHSEAADSYIR